MMAPDVRIGVDAMPSQTDLTNREVECRTTAADLRRGRNADAYLAAAAALAAGSLGLFGVVGLRWIGPVLPFCIVALLNLALSINDLVGRVSGEGPVQTIEFPAEQLREDWSRDSDILLVGVTLIRTLGNHESRTPDMVS
jgi:hypothetical protein